MYLIYYLCGDHSGLVLGTAIFLVSGKIFWRKAIWIVEESAATLSVEVNMICLLEILNDVEAI
jgi:hypothetical protein